MRTLKNLAIFAAGGLTVFGAFVYCLADRTNHPYEGGVVYEDDDIKVTRCSVKKEGDRIDIATVTYKHD